jgi:hypothetical protein
MSETVDFVLTLTQVELKTNTGRDEKTHFTLTDSLPLIHE